MKLAICSHSLLPATIFHRSSLTVRPAAESSWTTIVNVVVAVICPSVCHPQCGHLSLPKCCSKLNSDLFDGSTSFGQGYMTYRAMLQQQTAIEGASAAASTAICQAQGTAVSGGRRLADFRCFMRPIDVRSALRINADQAAAICLRIHAIADNIMLLYK